MNQINTVAIQSCTGMQDASKVVYLCVRELTIESSDAMGTAAAAARSSARRRAKRRADAIFAAMAEADAASDSLSTPSCLAGTTEELVIGDEEEALSISRYTNEHNQSIL